MYWVIKVSYRKRNAAGEKRFFGIRVLGVMAAVCVSLAAAGMRAEPVSAATGTQIVLEAAADTVQEAGYGDYDYSAIDRAVRQNSGYSISFQEIINQITGEDGVTGQGIFPVLNKTFLQVITGSKTAVSQIGAAETAKYLMDIPSCVIPQDTDSFDSVYSDISTGDEDLDTIFEEVSKEYGVNVNLLKAVAQAESGFDSQAVSSAGAMGIMQLMPATAESLGVEDPYDARQNITGGAKMLGYLLADYNGDVTLALAAYNAGSGAVRKYGGVPPYSETENYIRKINDILGGALDNDSTTVDGAEPTPVYGTSQDEEEVYYSAPVTQQYMAAAQIPVVQAGYQTAAQAYEAAYNSVISVISGQDYSGITQI